MTHGSLFSGIGGFDLAAEWMGWENLFHCEWNPFGQRVLKHYWPCAESFDDITKTDFTKYADRIDVLSGGFPCQPYSTAGKRLGNADERHLWPEMLRAVREIRPCYVVGENVRGLISWNGGLVFDEVQADLEAAGYEVLPFLLPACAVNAPHRRDRIWFVAHRADARVESMRYKRENTIHVHSIASHPTGQPGERAGTCGQSQVGQQEQGQSGGGDSEGFTPHSGSSGRKKRNAPDFAAKSGLRTWLGFEQRNGWQNFPTQSPVCSGDDGIPTELDGITFPKWRTESVKAYGNAIVPQIAYEIFKAIQHERTHSHNTVV